MPKRIVSLIITVYNDIDKCYVCALVITTQTPSDHSLVTESIIFAHRMMLRYLMRTLA